jgi:hypothetical protein
MWVRQDLAREHGIVVSLQTVEWAVAGLRQALRAEVRATARFETPRRKQPQIDFSETRVSIDGLGVRVYLFVATLGYPGAASCGRIGMSGNRPGSTG